MGTQKVRAKCAHWKTQVEGSCSISCQASAEFNPWMLWITRTWSWLYIATQNIWFIFIVILYFSKYGNMKLGKPNDKPDFR